MTGFQRLHPALQHHIVNSLEWPSLRPLQEEAIDPILDGKNVLLIAPTAGGKTEAALFPILSDILNSSQGGLSVLYICPLRALLNNLEHRLSYYCHLVGRTCALWHGDVAQTAKARVFKEPPDILLTTPESIEAILISSRVAKKDFFFGVRFVVLDELHAFAADDRGWHVWYLLKRLAKLTESEPQVLGLSATVGNPRELLSWISAHSTRGQQVISPASTSTSPPPEITIDYVGSIENAGFVIASLHRGEKRLVFCDSRSQAEKLASELRERNIETFVSHSSLSKDERSLAERAFAEGSNCVIVSTSTLELGIDVGDLDRVIQIDAPSTVASFLQRLGRTGRRSGTTRNCLFLATSSEALLRAAAIEHLWQSGWVEPVQPPPAPHHVAAQQALCLTLQERALPSSQLLEFVSQYGLKHLLTNNFLTQDGPLTFIGPETERLYGARNYLDLLSVFDSPPLFRVEWGNRELGWVHELSLQKKTDGSDTVILLSGRAWSVRSINWSAKVANVEPCELRGRSTWLGSSAPLSFELCQAMRQVLGSSLVSNNWTRRAGSELGSFRNLALTCSDRTVLQHLKSGCEWWTFAGLRVNATLSAWLRSANLACRFDSLSILCDTSPHQMAKAIEMIDASESPTFEDFVLPKFAASISPSQLADYGSQRFYDIARAHGTAEQLTVIATVQ